MKEHWRVAYLLVGSSLVCCYEAIEGLFCSEPMICGIGFPCHDCGVVKLGRNAHSLEAMIALSFYLI